MIVYVDIVFLVNFLISFTFLLLIKFLLNGKESIKVILLCSTLSVLLLFSFFLDKIFYTFFKVSGGLVVLSLTLFKTNLLEKIIRFILYYTMQFCLVGLTNAFHLQGMVLIVCIIILAICFIFYKYVRVINKKNLFERKIIIEINNKKICMNAYLDSGNMSTHMGKAIIYLDTRYLYIKEFLKKESTFINTVEGVFEKDIYYLKEINVEGKIYRDIYVSFGKLNNFECLLNVIMS